MPSRWYDIIPVCRRLVMGYLALGFIHLTLVVWSAVVFWLLDFIGGGFVPLSWPNPFL